MTARGAGRYHHEDLRRFVVAAAAAVGVESSASRDLGEVLVEADLRGVGTHGLRRLPGYLNRVRSGAMSGRANPLVDVHAPGAITVDGRNGVGPHIAIVAADAVARQAETSGTAVATVRGSNHFAFAGYYATRIAAHGMIAVVSSNGTPSIATPGGTRPFLCNDPIALSAPLGDDGFLELDMAMSVTSRDNIRRAAENGDSIPLGWAQDGEGRPTTNASAAMQGTLAPMGGSRGFALIFAFEVLNGLLAGAAMADEVPSKDVSPDLPENLGHFLLAVNITSFVDAGDFEARLGQMISRMQKQPRLRGKSAPRYPGQRRWETRADRLMHGIPLEDATVQSLMTLGGDLGIDLPTPSESLD